MKIKVITLALVLGCIGISCSNDDDSTTNPIDSFLGDWEISSRSFNGITPLITPIGNISFSDDSNTSDNKGLGIYIDAVETTSVTFEVSRSVNTITFTNPNDSQYVYVYRFTETGGLIFTYQDDGVEIEEIWIKDTD